ncbi:MAG: hypothetical protein VKK04_04770 [Synechococcales bacterium]|nr:hypothetical protein [Synechococcales bacterium]
MNWQLMQGEYAGFSNFEAETLQTMCAIAQSFRKLGAIAPPLSRQAIAINS